MACCLCGCFPPLPRVATWLGSGGSTLFPFLGNWFLIGWLFALLLELAFLAGSVRRLFGGGSLQSSSSGKSSQMSTALTQPVPCAAVQYYFILKIS